jgi:hypothetical protein
MMNWKAAGLAIAVVGTAPLAARGTAHAQRCATCTPDSPRRIHLGPALGLHVGTPQKASAALGLLVGEEWREDFHDHARNIAVYAEPGLSAGRASIAYVDHGYGNFGSGFAIAGTVMRTWKDPWTAAENMTYAGGEVVLWPIVFVGPRVGVFRSISGTPSSKKWFVSLDIGIGL